MPKSTDIAIRLETAERVALAEAKRAADPDHRRRIDIIVALNSVGNSATAKTIAERLGCSRTLLYRTRDLYLSGGRTPESLRAKTRGRPDDRREEVLDALQAIHHGTEEELTVQQYRTELETRLGLTLTEGSVRRYLRNALISWRRA